MMQLLPWLQCRFYYEKGSEVGKPLSLGKVEFFEAGTTDHAPTYQNEGGAQNDNPVQLNINGEAQIWLDPSLVYDVVVSDKDGVEQLTRERVSVGGGGGNIGNGFVRKFDADNQAVNLALNTHNTDGGTVTSDGYLVARDGQVYLWNSVQSSETSGDIPGTEQLGIILSSGKSANFDSKLVLGADGTAKHYDTVSNNDGSNGHAVSLIQELSNDGTSFVLWDSLHGAQDRYARLSDIPENYITGIIDTNTVNLEVTAGNISADVRTSAQAGNAIQVKNDGLFVPTVESPVQGVGDTNTIDMNLSPSGNLSANVNVSADAGNILSVHSDGLYAESPLQSVSDTTTIDITLAGGDLSADAKISTASGNLLSVADAGYPSEGLYSKKASSSLSCVRKSVDSEYSEWGLFTMPYDPVMGSFAVSVNSPSFGVASFIVTRFTNENFQVLQAGGFAYDKYREYNQGYEVIAEVHTDGTNLTYSLLIRVFGLARNQTTMTCIVSDTANTGNIWQLVEQYNPVGSLYQTIKCEYASVAAHTPTPGGTYAAQELSTSLVSKWGYEPFTNIAGSFMNRPWAGRWNMFSDYTAQTSAALQLVYPVLGYSASELQGSWSRVDFIPGNTRNHSYVEYGNTSGPSSVSVDGNGAVHSSRASSGIMMKVVNDNNGPNHYSEKVYELLMQADNMSDELIVYDNIHGMGDTYVRKSQVDFFGEVQWGTSSGNIDIGQERIVTASTGLAFEPGQIVHMYQKTNPAANYRYGKVVSYNKANGDLHYIVLSGYSSSYNTVIDGYISLGDEGFRGADVTVNLSQSTVSIYPVARISLGGDYSHIEYKATFMLGGVANHGYAIDFDLYYGYVSNGDAAAVRAVINKIGSTLLDTKNNPLYSYYDYNTNTLWIGVSLIQGNGYQLSGSTIGTTNGQLVLDPGTPPAGYSWSQMGISYRNAVSKNMQIGVQSISGVSHTGNTINISGLVACVYSESSTDSQSAKIVRLSNLSIDVSAYLSASVPFCTVYLDAATGTLGAKSGGLSASDRSSGKVSLCVPQASNGTTVSGITYNTNFVRSAQHMLRDMFDISGNPKSGMVISGRSDSLGVNVSVGKQYIPGSNIASGSGSYSDNTDVLSVDAQSMFQMYWATKSGLILTPRTTIDPSNYNPSGSTVSALDPNHWVNHRIFTVQDSNQDFNGNKQIYVMQYGQVQYANKSDALSGLSSEVFTLNDTTSKMTCIGIITIKTGSTNTVTDTVFTQTDKWGGIGGGSGASTSSNSNVVVVGNRSEFDAAMASSTITEIFVNNNSLLSISLAGATHTISTNKDIYVWGAPALQITDGTWSINTADTEHVVRIFGKVYINGSSANAMITTQNQLYIETVETGASGTFSTGINGTGSSRYYEKLVNNGGTNSWGNNTSSQRYWHNTFTPTAQSTITFSVENVNLLVCNAALGVPGALMGSSFMAPASGAYKKMWVYNPNGAVGNTILSVYKQTSPGSLTKLADTGIVSSSSTGYVGFNLTSTANVTAGDVIWLFLQITSDAGSGSYSPAYYIPTTFLSQGNSYMVFQENTIRTSMPNTLSTYSGSTPTMVPWMRLSN